MPWTPALFRGLACWAAFPVVALAAALPTDPAATERHARAHLTFLADDLLEGRGPGTRGYALAAKYVAATFQRLGLQPGADGDAYEQPVRLIEATNNLDRGRLVRHHDGRDESFEPITDMTATVTVGETEGEVTAPAVFVGFGVQAPELNHDDLTGIDLQGKIAVLFFGAPSSFPNDARAHYSNSETKRTALVKAGAVGLITVLSPRDEALYPWAVLVAQARFSSMRLLGPDGRPMNSFPSLRANALVTRSTFARLLEGSGHALEDVFAAARTGAATSFPLSGTITIGGSATHRVVESMNVLGWLPGSDPALARNPVVVTAHLDHMGIGPAVDGDAIYNGAYDNGMGVSLLLATAETLAQGPAPRRPVLFAALTAEERGLLGAVQLAEHPPARVERFDANVNIDMPLFFAAARDVVGYGAEHSTLGKTLAEVVVRHQLTLTPDPLPDEVLFIRSDQYPFVKRGVPALFLDTGIHAEDPAIDLPAVNKVFRRTRYHRPTDDLHQTIVWSAAGKYGAMVADLIHTIADDPVAPTWLPGDFFGDRFAPKK